MYMIQSIPVIRHYGSRRVCISNDEYRRPLLERNFEVAKTPKATTERLFVPGTNLIYVAKSEPFHVIHEIHLLRGHGTRDTYMLYIYGF